MSRDRRGASPGAVAMMVTGLAALSVGAVVGRSDDTAEEEAHGA